MSDSTSATLNIDSFKAIFNEKAKEELTEQALQKMDLVKESVVMYLKPDPCDFSRGNALFIIRVVDVFIIWFLGYNYE